MPIGIEQESTDSLDVDLTARPQSGTHSCNDYEINKKCFIYLHNLHNWYDWYNNSINHVHHMYSIRHVYSNCFTLLSWTNWRRQLGRGCWCGVCTIHEAYLRVQSDYADCSWHVSHWGWLLKNKKLLYILYA